MTVAKAQAGPELHWKPIPLEAIREARERTRDVALRTPLVRLDADDLGLEVFLKLESLQPVRSFKLRGAYNLMTLAGEADPAALAAGVWTASSGNMAQAVAFSARALGVPCTVYVPETVPRSKIANVRRYGGTVVELPVEEWEEIFRVRGRAGAPGLFVHPYSDPAMMAGSGVIGLEILEDLPEVDAVVAPWGGGGLSCGIASAIKALRPATKVYASEIETGAPLTPSLAAGRPVDVPFVPSFADGIGGSFTNQEMFDLARRLLDGAIVVSRAETAAAARLILERNRMVPEGAAATALAAALSGRAGGGRIVCVVSGGNIDAETLIALLRGETPD
jgi:threonine dehydratase